MNAHVEPDASTRRHLDSGRRFTGPGDEHGSPAPEAQSQTPRNETPTRPPVNPAAATRRDPGVPPLDSCETCHLHLKFARTPFIHVHVAETRDCLTFGFHDNGRLFYTISEDPRTWAERRAAGRPQRIPKALFERHGVLIRKIIDAITAATEGVRPPAWFAGELRATAEELRAMRPSPQAEWSDRQRSRRDSGLTVGPDERSSPLNDQSTGRAGVTSPPLPAAWRGQAPSASLPLGTQGGNATAQPQPPPVRCKLPIWITPSCQLCMGQDRFRSWVHVHIPGQGQCFTAELKHLLRPPAADDRLPYGRVRSPLEMPALMDWMVEEHDQLKVRLARAVKEAMYAHYAGVGERRRERKRQREEERLAGRVHSARIGGSADETGARTQPGETAAPGSREGLNTQTPQSESHNVSGMREETGRQAAQDTVESTRMQTTPPLRWIAAPGGTAVPSSTADSAEHGRFAPFFFGIAGRMSPDLWEEGDSGGMVPRPQETDSECPQIEVVQSIQSARM